jgi:A1 cistron-splicing factor AAR2
MVHLLCSCVDAISEHPSLYLQFISVLHRHVTEIPSDFFVDITTRDNFLVDALRCLFENIDASVDDVVTADIKRRSKLFRDHLERKFNWDFGAELGEYAPVIVDDV